MSLKRFFFRGRWDDERARELEAYLAIETDENIARGMTPDDARMAAQRKLGNATLIREAIYEMNSIGPLETVRLDLRDVWRQIRRRRHVTLTTALLLALGIGASTAGFSIAYGTLLRPLPYPDADRLATLWQETQGRREQISAPDLRDLRVISAFEAVAALWSGRGTLIAGIDVDRVMTVEAEHRLLPMLGARAALGRLTGESDEGQPVMLISDRLWRSVFHADPAVVGRAVQLSGRAFTVVGVLAGDLDFELPVGGGGTSVAFTIKDVDVWMPFGAGGDFPNSRSISTYEAVVKMAPGITVERAQRAVDAIAANLTRQYPDTNRTRGFRIVPLREQIVGSREATIWVGFAGALLILAIACVNTIGLALGELPARRRDFALRTALGAGRSRLLRQVALESVILGGVAGAAGIGLARAVVHAFTAAVELPRFQDIRFDWPVALFAIAAAFVSAFAARLVPMTRLDAGVGGLRGSTSAHTASAPRVRRALVAAQLAIALLLCTTAALFAASLRAVLLVNPGFASSHVLSMRVSAYEKAYPQKADAVRFFGVLVSRLNAIPGISAAAAGSGLPLSGSVGGTTVMAEGRPLAVSERPSAGWQSVTPGYFGALGMQIVAGRDFEPADLTRSTHHVVINQTLARRLFGNARPVGRRLAIGGGPVTDWHEIIGVVADVRHSSLTEAPTPRAYDLFGEHWSRTLFVVTRGDMDANAAAPLVHREVQRLDPQAPVFEVRTLDDLVGAATSQRRAATTFAAGVALASLLLSAVGVYGLLASSVAARTREIGVRRALGSSTGRLVALVVRETMGMSALGIAAGLAIAFASARVIQAQLFGIAATDPRVMATVTGLLVAVAGLASVVPARRAARIDPAITLRDE